MKQNKALMLIIGGIAAVVLVAVVSGLLLVVKEKPTARKRQVQMVTLVKPPPPPPPPPQPEMKEQPPEQKEVMEESVVEEAPQQDVAEDVDAPPPGELLGLDAEGGSGSDGFGLVGRKGGRSLVGSGNGGGGVNKAALLQQFAWYTRIVREELENLVRRHLEENGGIPKGELQTIVKIQLDEQGRVNAFKIEGSSGNTEMDRAVAKILETAAVNEPPPEEMPKIIKLKISSQG